MFKLQKIVAKDAIFRKELEYIFIDDENVIATDAHLLLCIPKKYIFEDIEIKDVYIRPQDWSKLITSKTKSFDYRDGYLTSLDKKEEIIYTCKPIPKENIGKYADYKAVKPNELDVESIDEIGLQTKNIKKIMEVLGDINIKLSFFGKNRNILITPSDKELKEIWGIIMPIRLDE